MDTNTALGYVREFLRLYWANEHVHEAWSRELESEHGMTAKQYALLRAITRQDDITTTDLTVLLGKAQPAITQMLNRLEKGGFVTRETSSADKRKREVKLTPKAQKVLDRVEPIGPTRVALAIEHATERQAGEIVKAMGTVLKWSAEKRP